MLRKAIVFAITTGLAAKLYRAYRQRLAPARTPPTTRRMSGGV